MRHLSVTDVAKWTQELVKAEQVSRDLWRNRGEDEQRIVFMLIRCRASGETSTVKVMSSRLVTPESWSDPGTHDGSWRSRVIAAWMEDILAEELRATLSTMSEHLKVSDRDRGDEFPPT